METTKTVTVETLVANATRLGHESQTVALACAFLPGLGAVTSLCCWCADKRYGWNVKAFRLPRGGECMACAYAGNDCLVIAPE